MKSKNIKYISKWLRQILGSEEPYFSVGRVTEEIYDLIIHTILRDNILSPDIPLVETNDAVHISERLAKGGRLLIDICSPRKRGVDITTKFIFSLPGIRSSAKTVWKTRKSHSSHWSALPQIAAIRLWLQNKETIEWIPDYLLSYISGSVRYFLDREWRTSIVLSAIAAETLLADMFEEEFHSPAPDEPLGKLKAELINKTKTSGGRNILTGIERSVNIVNDMRIAAVHRGTRKVSNEEAYNALTGVAKFVIWHFYS